MDIPLISAEEFYAFCNNPDIKQLKFSYQRPKIVETAQGEMAKIFYPPRKWYSLRRYRSDALRFYSHAKRLLKAGFVAPHVCKIQYCAELNTYIIFYHKIPGKTIDCIAKSGDLSIIHDVAAYLAVLHEKGVFFRAIHMGNLLHQENGRFALLDISDLQMKKRSLSIYQRYRNLKHLFLSKHDSWLWQTVSAKRFLESYFRVSGLSRVSCKILALLFKLNRIDNLCLVSPE